MYKCLRLTITNQSVRVKCFNRIESIITNRVEICKIRAIISTCIFATENKRVHVYIEDNYFDSIEKTITNAIKTCKAITLL